MTTDVTRIGGLFGEVPADALGRLHDAAARLGAGLDPQPLAVVITAWSESERRNSCLAARLGDLESTGAMMDNLLRLTIASEPAPPSAVAEALANGLDVAVAMFDPAGRLVAAHPGGGPVVVAVPDLMNRAAADPNRVIHEPGTTSSPHRYAVAIRTAARSEGAILVVRRRRLSVDAVHGLCRAAHVVAALQLRQEALLRAYQELRTDLLTELLSARRPLSRPARILAQARRFGLDRPCVVVAVEGDAALDRVVADAAGVLGGVGGRHEGLAVAVLPGDDPRAAAETMAARIRHITGQIPGVCASDPVEPVAGGLPDAFETARHGLALLRAVGSANRCVTTRDLALYRPLFDPERSGDVQDLLDAALRPLIDYEREHKVDLVETVRVFLATGGSASQAARRLYIHPNTMTKRLERVARLLGDGWQDGVDGLRLRLALHLRSLGTDPQTDLYERAAG